MNCQTVRACFEDPLRPDFDLRAASEEVAEHLTSCGDCSRFVQIQRKLGAGLRLTRESAPRLPASLDAAVLNSYRRHEWSSSRSAGRSFARRPQFAVWGWSAVAAAIVLAAVILLVPRRATGPVAAKPQQIPAASQAVNQTVNTVPGGAEDVTPRPVNSKPAVIRPNPAPAATVHKDAITQAAVSSPALPASFRGLMYCDALSCGGAMEVIRVQLPSSAAALAPSSVSNGEAVYADVLVGPDGIARGIRIVE